jgi:hypothetical protein
MLKAFRQIPVLLEQQLFEYTASPGLFLPGLSSLVVGGSGIGTLIRRCGGL